MHANANRIRMLFYLKKGKIKKKLEADWNAINIIFKINRLKALVTSEMLWLPDQYYGRIDVTFTTSECPWVAIAWSDQKINPMTTCTVQPNVELIQLFSKVCLTWITQSRNFRKKRRGQNWTLIRTVTYVPWDVLHFLCDYVSHFFAFLV